MALLLGLVAVAVAGVAGAVATGDHACPAWLGEYARWHAQQDRVQCNKLSYVALGSGFGDRIRGLFWALRMAVATGRCFRVHIKISDTLNLQDLFEPTEIDWRFDAEQTMRTYLGAFTGLGACGKYGTHRCEADAPVTYPLLDMLNDPSKKDVFISGNPRAGDDLWGVPGGERYAISEHWTSGDVHCLWQAVFRPTLLLQTAIEQEHQALVAAGLLRASEPFTAVHMRLGNLEGERERVDRGDRYDTLLGVLTAAHANGWPVYMATSDSALRDAVRAGMFANVTGPHQVSCSGSLCSLQRHDRKEAVHSERSDFNHLHTFAELGMLARGTCGVWTESGFSNVARWWGGSHACAECIGCSMWQPET